MVDKASIHPHNADSASLPAGHNHLIQHVTGVGLNLQGCLNGVQPGLAVVEANSFNADIRGTTRLVGAQLPAVNNNM